MESEHCKQGGSKDLFPVVAGKKKRITCSEYEWAITVHGNYTHADPDTSTRSLKKIEELMKQAVVEQANLTRCEVIAVVLYTGPMVSWTNFDEASQYKKIC